MKPRLVRLFVIMALLVAAFVWLGNWQWQTAHNKANQKALQRSSQLPMQPLDAVLKPQTPFDNATSLQPVSLGGRYEASKTELIAGRVLNGEHGWWVLTPVVVEGSGARLPVVRGFVDSARKIPPPPTGRVRLEGALAPGESVSTLGALPEGQLGSIDVGLLLNEWGGHIYDGFIFLTKQSPPTAAQPGTTAVTHVPPPVPRTTHIEWRNAAYAVQWWVFALFAVFMWVKLVREDMLDDADAQSGSEGSSTADRSTTGDEAIHVGRAPATAATSAATMTTAPVRRPALEEPGERKDGA